jgi:hypothetical protein
LCISAQGYIVSCTRANNKIRIRRIQKSEGHCFSFFFGAVLLYSESSQRLSGEGLFDGKGVSGCGLSTRSYLGRFWLVCVAVLLLHCESKMPASKVPDTANACVFVVITNEFEIFRFPTMASYITKE